MLLSRYLLVVICGVVIASGAVSDKDVKKAVGDQVSFKLDKMDPPVTSITWKHIGNSGTVKAIEWEDEAITIPNPRFRGITALNTTTGQITITKLTVEHSGDYTIDVSGKEQAQRFTLTVMARVPKPVIKTEKIEGNTDVVYLVCKYSGNVIWKNTAGEKLTVLEKGDTITVKKTEGNPENAYTCTLSNDVSEETSDPIYKKDLFKDESDQGPWWIAIVILGILGLFATPPVLYKFCKPFHDWVYKSCGKKPYIGGLLSCLDGKNKEPIEKPDANCENKNENENENDHEYENEELNCKDPMLNANGKKDEDAAV